MFQVELAEAEKFAKVWNKNGIHILLQPEAIQFANDWANVVLNNFVAKMQAEYAQAQAKAAELQKPKIILEGIK